MLTKVTAGPYTIRGVSVGGVYTSLHVPELGALLDAGIAARSTAAAPNIFISHGHADHIGALPTILGIRGLHKHPPARVFVPTAAAESLKEAIGAVSKLQRHELAIDVTEVEPGQRFELRSDLAVRVFRTHHTVPSVGYQFVRPVNKLKAEYRDLPGAEIARRRALADDLFDHYEHLELAYATDTLLSVIDSNESLLRSKVLVLECSFVDERKSLKDSRAGCHIHLDELLERAADFDNEHIVLMHFSQIASPDEVREILARRCPKDFYERLRLFVPARGDWPG
jgi:ribonuclease Z